MASKLYKDDLGTVFQVDVGTDVSGASALTLKVRKPKGTRVSWTGAVNGATNTQIDYTIIADDLDEVGTYKLQSHVVTPTWTGRGETVDFTVYDLFA